MSEGYKSYQQGGYDTECELGICREHSFENQGVNDDCSTFYPMEYQRGQITALINAVKYLSGSVNRAANTASCLANGIIPD